MLRKRLSLSKKFFLSTLIATGFVASAPSALAATYYWDVDGATAIAAAATGTWTAGSTANWSTDATGASATAAVTTSNADDLFFAATGMTAGTITLATSSTQNAHSINFGNSDEAFTITGGTAINLGSATAGSGVFNTNTTAQTISTAIILNSSTTAFNFSNSGTGLLTIGAVTGSAASQVITVGSSSTGGITLNGIIGNGTGTVGLTISNTGAGVTTLSGANTFTGPLTISRGQVNATSAITSLGSALAANSLVLGDATNTGILNYSGTTGAYSRAITVNAGGGEIDSTTALLTLTPTSTVALGGALTIGGASNVSLTTTGAVIALTGSGTPALIKNGIGTFTITTATGLAISGAVPITINAGKIQQTSVVGAALNNQLGTGSLTFNPTAANSPILGISVGSFTSTYANAVNVNAAPAAQVGTAEITTSGGIILSGAIVLGGGGGTGTSTLKLTNTNGSAFALTSTGGVTGTGNLQLNSTGGAAAILISTGTVNLTGSITNIGTNTASTATISSPITTTNLTSISQAGASPFTISSDIALTSGLNIFTSTGAGTWTFSGASTFTGSQPLTLKANAAGAINVSGVNLNHTGTVTNSGTSTGLTTISSVIGTNVGGVIQNSVGSQLNISGANTTYAGGFTVISGTLGLATVGTSGGTSANVVTLGTAATPSTGATLSGNNTQTFVPLIQIGANANSGLLTITQGTTAGAIFTGNISTTSPFRVLSQSSGSVSLSGTISNTSGTGNNISLVNNSTAVTGLTLSGTSINPTGTITNSGSGTGVTLVSGNIGPGVTNVIQSSPTSSLFLSGTNTYNGSTTVTTGLLTLFNTASLPGYPTPTSGNVTVSATGTLGLGFGSAGQFTGTDLGNILSGTLPVTVAAGGAIGLDTTTASASLATNLGNFTGGPSSAVALALSKLGTNTLTLSGTNTYTGNTNILGGVLAANDGVSLPSSSLLIINGSTIGGTAATATYSPTSGTFTRAPGNAAGQVQVLGATSGFTALGTPTTINLGGAAASFQWGSANFNPGTLLLNDALATSTVNFQNAIDLNTAARTVTVNSSTLATAATLSGQLTGTGASGLTKAGTGILNVTNATNNFAGAITVSAGTLSFNGTGALPGGAGNIVNVNAGTLQILNDAVGTIAYGNVVNLGGTQAITVGNNGGATTGSTVAFGQLNAPATSTNTLTSTTFSSPNGYTTSFTGLALPGAGGNTTTLTANSNVTIAGNVTSRMTPAATSFNTLALAGTATGTITGVISDAAGASQTAGGTTPVTKAGTGTWILSGVNTYGGSTTVTGGTLVLRDTTGVGNAGAGTTVLTQSGRRISTDTTGGVLVNGGTLSIQNRVTIGNGTATGSVFQGIVSIGTTSNGILTLQDTSINTLTIGGNAATGVTTFLNLGGTAGIVAALNLDVGTSTTDQIVVTPSAIGGSGKLVLGAGGAAISLNQLPSTSLANGAYSLLTFAAGSTFTGAFSLANPAPSGKVYTLQLNNAVPASATAEQLLVTAGAGSGNVYFLGNLGSTWNTGSGTSATNFTSDYPGTTPSVLPDASTNVFFTSSAAATPANYATTTLGQALAVNSLNIVGAAPTIANPVGIGGTFPLTINAAAGFTEQGGVVTRAAGTGIVVQNLVTATDTISAPLILGGSQQWINEGQGTLAVTGGVTGAFNLTVNNNSTGVTTLSTGSVNNAGTLTNSGTGTGTTTITSIIGTNVLGVYQNSTTSNLSIAATNTFSYDGVTKFGLNIQAGTVLAGTNVAEFGGASGRVTLGDLNVNSNPATLTFNAAGTYAIATPIVLAPIANATGTLTIGLASTSSIGLTLSGGVTGNNNLTVNNSTFGSTGSPLFTGLVNNSGTITLIGTNASTTFATTFSNIGSNVTQITQNSSGFAPLAITALTVNSGGTTLVNSVSGAGLIGLLSVTGSVTGSGALILNNNSSTLTNGITVSGTVNQTGSITNSGTGTSTTLISGIIGANVSTVTQNGNSPLTLSNANLFTGGLQVLKGTVTGSNVTAFGPIANTVTLGGIGGSNNATLQATAITIAHPIALGTSSGTLTLANSTAAGTTTFSGPITGANNLTLSTSGAALLTLSNASLNFTGGVISTGNSTGVTTISSVIGANVNAITQNNTSLTSSLILTGANTAYAGTTTVNSGRLDAQNLGVTDSITALGTGPVQLNGGVLDYRANGSGSFKTITAANAITVGGTSTLDWQRISANTFNALQVNSLSIGASQLNVTATNNYHVNVGGATSITGAATFNPTTTSINLLGKVTDSGNSVTASGVSGAASGTFGQGVTRLYNTASGGAANVLTGTWTVNASTLQGYANAAGALSTGSNSLGAATISLSGASPVLNLAPTFNGGLSGTTPGLYDKGYTGVGSLAATNFMGASQAVAPTGVFAGLAVPAGGGVITTGLPVTAAATTFLATTSYQFTGLLNITNAGVYNFSSITDDGGNFFIDGNSSINTSVNTATGSYFLTAGLHAFTSRVNNNGTNGTVSVQYQGEDTGGTLINVPNSALSTYSTTAGLSSAAATVFGNNILFAGTSNATINTASNTTLGSLTMTGAAGTLNFQGSSDLTSITFTGATTLSNNLTINNPTANVILTGAIGDGGSNFGLTKNGFGTLTTSGSSTYGGITTISAGTLSTNGLAAGGSPSGVGQSSAAATNLVFTANSSLRYTGATQVSDRAFTINAGITATIDVSNSAANLTLPGATGAATTGALTKTGAGTLTLSGVNTNTGNTNVTGGTLQITGGTSLATAKLLVGYGAGASGAVIFDNSANINFVPGSGADFFSLGGTGGYGYSRNTGGTVTTGQLAIGGNTGGANTTGVFEQTSGTYTMGTAAGFVLTGWGSGAATNDNGILNVFGGSFINMSTANDTQMGFNASTGSFGMFNVVGSTAIFDTTAAGTQTARIIDLAKNTGNFAGVMNVNNGGTVYANAIRAANAGTPTYLGFDGGTVRANVGTTTFISGLTGATIYSGGLTIESGSFALTVPQALAGPSGQGLSSIPVLTAGSGYIGAPAVRISGGGGTGASAIAVVDLVVGSATYGQVTGFTITSAGSGYTSTPTITLIGGGATNAATIDTANIAISTNVNAGGLTKKGSSTLTLSGANTFGGVVDIQAGILATTTMANGGSTSGIGNSSSSATNLLLGSTSVGGGILQYIGTVNATSDRNFTLKNVNGGFDASGTGAGTFTLTSTGAMGVTSGLGPATLTLQGTGTGAAGAGSIAALIGDGTGTTVSLTKLGAGTWTVANTANSYTGPTVISGGTLSVTSLAAGGANSSIGASSNAATNLNFTASSTLQYTGATQITDRDFTIATGATATFDITNPAATLTLGGVPVATTGSLTKTSSGALIISGTGGYTGATTISGGTLQFAGSNALNSATAISMAAATNLQIRDDAAGTINHNTNTITATAAGTVTIDVGNNGGATTGSTVAFGALSSGSSAQQNVVVYNFTGANGYNQTYSSMALPAGTGASTTFNPTTTSVTINGNVTNGILAPPTAHLDTLFLNGTSTGNAINGVISDSPNFVSVGNGDTRITKQNASTWTLTNVSTYRGPTSITGGTLKLAAGSGLANTAITVSPAASGLNPTFAVTPGTGVINIGNNSTVAAGATLTLNAGTVANPVAGVFTMQDNLIGTVNLVQESTFAGNSLTLGGATAVGYVMPSLNFDIGGASFIDIDLFNTTKLATVGSGGVMINFAALTGSSSLMPGDYTFMTAGLGSNFNLAGGLTLGTSTIAVGPTTYSLSLGNSTATSGILTVTALAGSAAPFWQGSIDGSWASQPSGSGTNTNFATSLSGAVNTLALPDLNSNVTFTATTASNLSTTLDQNFTINSLMFNGTGTSNTAGSTIASGGGSNSLTINALAINGNLLGDGISVDTGSGVDTISANVIMGNSQNWTVASGSSLVVSGNVSGTGTALTLPGPGTVTLSGNNGYTGGTILNGGTLRINSNTAVGTGLITINASTIDNTTAGLVTLTNNNIQTWANNGAVAFTGTQALNLGAGAVTLGADAAAATFGITNNSVLAGTSLTVGGPITSGVGGVAGTKTLTIAGAGSTALTGSITQGTATGMVVTVTSPNTTTLSGAASNITTLNVNGGASSIVDIGAGSLTLSNSGATGFLASAGGTINATGGGTIVMGSNAGGVNYLDNGTANGTTLTVNAKISGTFGFEIFGSAGSTGITVLTGANTWTGGVNIDGGILSVGNIGNTASVSSNLGAGSNAIGISNTVLTGSTVTSNILRYTGNGETTDRAINLFGTTTGGAIEQAGLGLLKFTANLTTPGAGSKTFFLMGNTAGTGEIAGVIKDNLTGTNLTGVTKLGTGTWTLSALNTYTGTTTIDQGTLALTTAVTTYKGLTFGVTAGNTNFGTLTTTENQTFTALTTQNNNATANTITIAPTKTLTLTGNVQIGSTTPIALNSVSLLTIGGGGALNMTTAAGGLFQVGGNTTNATAASQNSIMDLTGLVSATINVGATGTVRVNQPSNGNANVAGNQSSLLLPTPVVALNTAVTTITTGSFNVGDGASNGSGAGQINSVTLGTGLTTLNANTVNVGSGNNAARDFGQIIFASGNGTLKLRAANGIGAVAFNIGIGGTTTGVSPGTGVTNNVDFTGHSVDLLLSTMVIGNQYRNTTMTSTMSFDTGTFDVNAVQIGFLSAPGGTQGATTHTNILNIGGGTVTIGNGGLDLGTTTSTAGTANKTVVGTVNVSGGTVTIANSPTLGAAVRLSNSLASNANAMQDLLNITGGSVTLAGDMIRGANVGGGTSSATLTLDGGSLDMSGNRIGGSVTASNLTTLNFRSGTLQNVAQINNGAAWSKTNAGNLLVTGTNTYTSGVTVSGGVLQVGSTTGLGFGGLQTTSTGTTTVASGFTLDLNGTSGVNEPITLSGTGIGGNGALINNSLTPASIDNGIAGIAVAATGSGSGFSTAPTVAISGTGAGATAIASLGITAATIGTVTVTGTYTAPPTVAITGGGGTGATATVSNAGVITITNAGTGYTSAPTITFTGGTGGTSMAATSNATSFTVGGLSLTAAGSGYTGTPTFTFNGGAATATPTLSSVILAADSSIGGSGNFTINSVVSQSGGTRALTKVGAGTVTLGGTNTYAGATTVSSGTLSINSTGTINSTSGVTIGSGNFNYNSATTLSQPVSFSGTGGTLSGIGSIGTAVTVTSGNKLSPGNSPGTMTFGSGLTIAPGATFQWENNLANALGTANTNWDVANVTGGTTTISSTPTSGSQLQLSFTDSGTSFGDSFWDAPHSWNFITGVSAPVGLFDISNISISVAGSPIGAGNTISGQGSFSTVAVGNNLQLQWQTLVTGNDSQILISSTPTTSIPATGVSTKNIALTSVFVGGASTTASQTLGKTGTDGTTYTVTSAGNIASTTFVSGSFGANGQNASGTITLANATSGAKSGTVTIDNTAADSLSAGLGSGDGNDVFTVTQNVFQTASLTGAASGGNLNLTNAASTDGGQRAGITISGFTLSNAATDNRRSSNFNAPVLAGGGVVGDATASNVTATVGTYSLKSDRLNNASVSYRATATATGGAYTDPALAALATPTIPTMAIIANQTGSLSAPDRTGVMNVYGSARLADIANGDTLAGYSSTVTAAAANSPNPGDRKALGTTATILTGTATSDMTVSMAWRVRGANESSSIPANNDNGTLAAGYLISDVVNLSGMGAGVTDTFVLQMSYNEALLGVDGPSAAQHEAAGAALGRIFLAWNDGGTWVNAVTGNTGGTAQFFNRDYSAGLDGTTLGHWGVDTTTNTVWAVLNHNSEFAVIPEPSTLVLGGLALLGFAGVGLRRRRLAKTQQV
jgi:fibronectin-binding autotransporter adhesin